MVASHRPRNDKAPGDEPGVFDVKRKRTCRYLAEFEFLYNTRKITDSERSVLAVKGDEGKRLTYSQPH